MLGLNQIDRPVLLAPMAGVTDAPFRRQAQAFGATYCVSEMIASDQLAHQRADMVRRAAGAGSIAPVVIQLAGREARWLARGAALAEEAGAEIIDINMGCPAKVVTSCAAGSALMRDPDHALTLIEATVNATSRPVSLKMRLGWDEKQLNAPEIARRAEAAGIQLITVHGRTRKQFFTGRADWSAVRAIIDAVAIPVIVNGDIGSAADAREAMKVSGAAGVMVGRAAQGRPWLTGAIATALRQGGEAIEPPRATMLQALLTLHDDTLSFYGAKLGGRVVRKHIAWAFDAIFGVSECVRTTRKRICVDENPSSVRAGIVAAFDTFDMKVAA